MISKLEQIIIKFFDVLPNISLPKVIFICVMAFLSYFAYILREPVVDYVTQEVRSGHSTVVVPHHSIPPAYQKEIETIAKQYVERNKDISLIVVYQFVPSGMNGFQGRDAVAIASTPSISHEFYGLQWQASTNFLAQMFPILSNQEFISKVSDIIEATHTLGDKPKQGYTTDVNFHKMYQDGMRMLISVPVMSEGRVTGYISVYFNREPSDQKDLDMMKQLARTIALDVTYFMRSR